MISMFQSYKAFVETQIRNKIKCLRFDNGGEYRSSRFIKNHEDDGIIRQYAMPYTFEQNGMLEWKNRTLVEVIHNMLATTKLPHILG